MLDAQSAIEVATTNLKSSETNYEIEKKRINLGTTTEDRMLQLESQLLTNKQIVEKAKYEFQTAQLTLKTFIGKQDSIDLKPLIPESIPGFSIDAEQAIEYAKKFNPDFIQFESRRLEALRNVAQAKTANRQVELVASYGLNNIGNSIGSIYNNPNSQQRFSIFFNVPIVDWGRRKLRQATAGAVEKLTEFNNEMDESSLILQISTIVKNYELLKNNIVLAQKREAVARRRFTLANELFQVGKNTVNDLKFAQDEVDNSRKNYLMALRQYWSAYFLIRQITLYDFEGERPLFHE